MKTENLKNYFMCCYVIPAGFLLNAVKYSNILYADCGTKFPDIELDKYS